MHRCVAPVYDSSLFILVTHFHRLLFVDNINWITSGIKKYSPAVFIASQSSVEALVCSTVIWG